MKQNSFVFNLKLYLHFSLSVKRKSGTASMNTDNQWSKKEACLNAQRGPKVWLAVDHNTSVTPGE